MKTMLIGLTALGLLAPPQDDLKGKLAQAYGRAADWIVSQQGDDGSWKEKGQPSIAYTGLIVAALGDAPADLKPKFKPALDKGVAYIVSKQNDDGSFGEMGGQYLKVYSTSIALMALSLAAPDKK